MKYLFFLFLFFSTAAIAQPAEFETGLLLPLNDTTIEGISYQRRLEGTQLHYNLTAKTVVVRAAVITYRNRTVFFGGQEYSRLYANIEIIADNGTMVDSMGNIQMTYIDYQAMYFDDSLQAWKPGTPRLWREYQWYQFVASFVPVIIHDAIRQAMYRWAVRRGFVTQ